MEHDLNYENFNEYQRNDAFLQFDESNDYIGNMFVVSSNKEFSQINTIYQQPSQLQEQLHQLPQNQNPNQPAV